MTQLRFVGVGGQGVILAGEILSAAKIADGAVTSAKIENEGVIWEKRTKQEFLACWQTHVI